MLFLGLVAFLLLRLVLTSAPLDPAAVVVVAVLAIPSVVPFALYLRAALAPTGTREPTDRPAT
jgi:hypothetical protein